ncbi:MAG: PLP-dependent aspartate aminotransferase family protein [Actinomycetales bacterium]|nr:PLP-dependent aspartate aminotransferase family protein [Actinomycetales bacterium]
MPQGSDGFSTRAIHDGERKDPTTGALNTPIYATATFAFDTAREKEAAVDAALEWEPGAFFYSRTGNPTTAAFEAKMASLEGAEDCVASSAGMASVAAALLSVLDAGDHCIASDDLFIITRFLLDDVLASKGITVDHVDITDHAAVEAAIRPNTKVLFVEALSNPHMRFADIPALADLAHGHGLVLIVDNTFLSPYLLRPVELGADIVVHAATKYIGGHGDVVAGTAAGSKARVDRMRYYLDSFGGALSVFNSWLLLRGVKTLQMRMRVHSANGLAVAEYLQSRPEVEVVNYPGLASHAQHDLAARTLADGFGGMLSLRFHAGERGMEAFCEGLRLSAIAVSLGDLHSLAYPMPKRNSLVRLSVGCEDVDDLLEDYERGIAAVAAL